MVVVFWYFFAFCSICILFHLYFVSFAFRHCRVCILEFLHFVMFVFWFVCILALYFVLFELWNICILTDYPFSSSSSIKVVIIESIVLILLTIKLQFTPSFSWCSTLKQIVHNLENFYIFFDL